MQTFDLNDLAAENVRGDQRWREFLRVPSLSMGLYRLKAGQADEQRPHTEDEVYVVVSGKASFRAGGQEQAVAPGSVIFVERAAEHRLLDITADLTVLVFFAPPEGSLKVLTVAENVGPVVTRGGLSVSTRITASPIALSLTCYSSPVVRAPARKCTIRR